MTPRAALLILALTALVIASTASAQCNPPNITATRADENVPIGKDLVIDYVTPRHHNGMWIYTLYSLFPGSTPIGFGYCLPLAPPINLLGASYVAANKSQFRYTVPLNPALVGVNLHLAGMIANGTPIGTGASNGVLAHIRQEDWPLP